MRYRTRILVAALVVLVSGVAHGIWVNRWTTSTDLERAAARLERVPMTIGGWQGEDLPPDPRRVDAELAGTLTRQYRDPATGRSVKVVVVCGPSGPVVVHTPIVCLGANGFELKGDPTPYHVDAAGTPAEFVLGKFVRSSATGPTESWVLWSWTATGPWTTPSQPRWTFARHRALYKLYVIFDMPPGAARLEDDARTEFLGQLLPALHRALFEETTVASR